MDIDLSRSSMPFLRVTGPGISVEELFQALQNDSSSSTSNDASSAFDEESLRFSATLSHCATISIFHSKGLPNTEAGTSSNLPPSFSIRPILIERKALEPQLARQDTATLGLELVPWKPYYPALLLQLWPEILEAASNKSVSHVQSVLNTNPPGEDNGPTSSPPGSEIQTS